MTTLYWILAVLGTFAIIGFILLSYIFHTSDDEEYEAQAFEERVTNKIVNSALVKPEQFYVGVFTSPPDTHGNGDEAVWLWYERQPVTFTVSKGIVSNFDTVKFPANESDSMITLTHTAVFDAKEGGNMIMSAPFDRKIHLHQGDVLSIPKDDLRITID